ncbi:TetR/AcrR family transcriptional regulator [Tissierella sp. MSJ-40]|uniref:TetR/AcrR family transcriptional regulator n=1 Tax=Tissierella simiarum TaxID=2841534 RepID=A0ABS6E9X8_9FIRM|nr:TetR/AcrR family transcriptional regulator [Tissierella simiarum]MBU5439564.1 TetR/AcrR family transcriptional regulator [Tissierella simiarum]
MTKVRKSADERKEQILDEAFKLFSNGKYNLIVMEDIAKACNIARTTLYEYYSSKEDILIALVERVSFESREIKFRGNTCREQLEYFAEDLIEKIRENKDIYRILFQATPVMSEKLSSKLINWREQNFQQVYKAAKMGKDSGEFREEISVEDVTFVYQAYLGQRMGEFIMKDEDIDPKMEAKRLGDMLWNGIGKNV